MFFSSRMQSKRGVLFIKMANMRFLLNLVTYKFYCAPANNSSI